MTSRRSLVGLVAGVLTILAAPAWGKAPPNVNKRALPKKILELDEMRVEGRIQKPQAMFLMPRANLNYGDLDRSESFLPKVTKAVEKDPF